MKAYLVKNMQDKTCNYFASFKEAKTFLKDEIKKLALGQDYRYTSREAWIKNTLVLKIELIEFENY